jgi:CxxC motif-containing protein (DUF1111 family)
MRRKTLPIIASSIALGFACADNPPPSAPRQVPTEARTTTTAGDEEQVGLPLSGLTAAQLDRFNRGRDVFTRVFSSATGLGPSFNAASCAGCHEEPAVGGSGDDLDEDVETHVSVVADGTCDALAVVGGTVIQKHTTDLLQSYYSEYFTEPIPPEAGTSIGRRSTPALFGFGLLEGVPTSTILSFGDPFDFDGDGISGRPAVANFQVLRFGRKPGHPNLTTFNAGAFQNEMGITNSVAASEQLLMGVPFPFDATIDPISGPELSDEDLSLATDFVRLLRPLPEAERDALANGGRDIFSSIGCATCHVPTLRTGSSPIAALNYVKFYAFTDLLLHNMGPGLADICGGNTRPREFRTEPLAGLHFRSHYLHDARATTLEDAILQHGGEATRARNRFTGLTQVQRSALIAYLNTL